MNMTSRKAIYTKIDGQYCQINQLVATPNVLCGGVVIPHSQMEIRDENVTASIWADNIDRLNEPTNQDLYTDMINHFRSELVKEIPLIQNRYVLYVDYSVYNENNVEVKHSVVTDEITAIDSFYPQTVGTSQENCPLSYKLVKKFDGSVSFAAMKQEYPFGIIKDTSKNKFVLVINCFKIFQDTIYKRSGGVCGRSGDLSSYPYETHTIESSLDSMKLIYTGYKLIPVEVSFIPKSVTLSFHIVLDNYIVASDQYFINDIIIENIAKIKQQEEESSNEDNNTNTDDNGSGDDNNTNTDDNNGTGFDGPTVVPPPPMDEEEGEW